MMSFYEDFGDAGGAVCIDHFLVRHRHISLQRPNDTELSMPDAKLEGTISLIIRGLMQDGWIRRFLFYCPVVSESYH